MVRGAVNSFVPESYFENAGVDRDKWEALRDRLEDRGARIRSVLDVGCGTGAYLAYLRDEIPGTHREGIELDPVRAAEARTRDPEARIHHADALAALAQATGPFDLVTLWDVFEHVPAPAALLQGIARVLAPGGCIFLQTINEHSLVPALGRFIYHATLGRLRLPARRTHEPHHLVFPTRRGLQHAARTAGLRIRLIWFDRLHRRRMDGTALLTAATSLALRAENALGGGLFVNLLLEADPEPSARPNAGEQ
jgi:2-polyprenyl-3-methyl-5-hydroxy-6-metoxy-1,4-benzoquinol methylase